MSVDNVQEPLYPAVASDQEFAQLSFDNRPGSKAFMRGMGASYNFGSRDHVFEQGLL